MSQWRGIYPFYEIGASDAGMGSKKPELLFVGNSLTSMESKDITSTSTSTWFYLNRNKYSSSCVKDTKSMSRCSNKPVIFSTWICFLLPLMETILRRFELRFFPHPKNMIIWNYYEWGIQYYVDLKVKSPSLSLRVSIIYITVYLDSAKNLYTARWKNTGFSCFDVWSSETTLTSLIAHICSLPLL